MRINGIDTTTGMTTAEIRPLAGRLRDGVRLIDYFFFPSVPNCLAVLLIIYAWFVFYGAPAGVPIIVIAQTAST
jgi:hypothetical protein